MLKLIEVVVEMAHTDVSMAVIFFSFFFFLKKILVTHHFLYCRVQSSGGGWQSNKMIVLWEMLSF